MAKKMSERKMNWLQSFVGFFVSFFVCLFIVKSFLVAEEFWSTYYLGHGCRTLETTYSLPEFVLSRRLSTGTICV